MFDFFGRWLNELCVCLYLTNMYDYDILIFQQEFLSRVILIIYLNRFIIYLTM